jgi:hypothetical protein
VTETPRRRRQGRAPDGGAVLALDRARIERALPRRERYKYVQPRVLAEGGGWKIVSPNCSRSVDPAGGEIDIARFLPAPDGLWRLQARNDTRAAWITKAEALTLAAALARVMADPLGEYWR